MLGADGRKLSAIMHGGSRDGEEFWETPALERQLLSQGAWAYSSWIGMQR